MPRPPRSKLSSQKLEILDDVMQLVDSGRSQREACRLVSRARGLSEHTIRSIIRRIKKNEEGFLENHGNAHLTTKQEHALVGFLLGKSRQSQGLQIDHFLNTVRRIHGNKPEEQTFGRKWFKGFMKRNQKWLEVDKSELLGPSRSNPDNLQKILHFIDFQCDFLARHHFPAHAIFNVDESRVTLAAARGTGKRIHERGRKGNTQKGKRESKYLSVVPFVSADGHVVCCFIVIPLPPSGGVVYIPHTVARELRGSFPIYYTFTETGYTNESTFPPMVEKFLEHFTLQWPGLASVLYMDRLSNHMSDTVLAILTKAQCQGTFFSPGSTQIDQPLDDVAFACFKSLLETLRNQNLSAQDLDMSRGRSPLLAAVIPAIERSLTPAAIKASFNNVGLYPWNPAKVREIAEKYYPNDSVTSLELGTTSQEILSAVIATTPTTPRATVTPYQIHRDNMTKLFTLDDIVEENRRYEEEKRQLEEQKEERKRIRAQNAEKRRQEEIERKNRAEMARREREQRREQQQGEQQRISAERTCCFCRKRWRGGSAWLWCDNCNTYLICPACRKDPHKWSTFAQHDRECNNVPNPPLDTAPRSLPLSQPPN